MGPGDHVIVAWSPPCEHCRYCVDRKQPHLCSNIQMVMGGNPHFRLDGQSVSGFAGAGTFAEEMILPWQGVVRIDDDVPLEIASLVGCGVMTGVGAAINTAKVTPGSSVVVFGCGGVGISCIQGARVAGAAEIVAVDLVESKLATALEFGATHAVHPDGLASLAASLTSGDGFDFLKSLFPRRMPGRFPPTRRGEIFGPPHRVQGRREPAMAVAVLEVFAMGCA